MIITGTPMITIIIIIQMPIPGSPLPMQRKFLQISQRLLVARYPDSKDQIESNLKIWLAKLRELEQEFAEAMKALSGKKILVYHPAWGSFLEEYGIEQVALEHEGKALSAKRLALLSKTDRTDFIPVILVTPFMSDSLTEQLTTHFGMPCKVSHPVPEDYIAELKHLVEILVSTGD
jgi:zinc transport system substrate-binding protein